MTNMPIFLVRARLNFGARVVIPLSDEPIAYHRQWFRMLKVARVRYTCYYSSKYDYLHD